MMSSDLKASGTQPKALAQQIVGKKCWRATFGYAGEVHLHCGAHVPYRTPKMAGKTKGAWRLGTSGTEWRMVTPQGEIRSRGKSEKQLEGFLKLLEGSLINSFQVIGNVRTIKFSNNCKLQVIPTPKDDEYDLPYWELFIPKRRHIAFGPRGKWFVGPSDARS